jgi:hypothetical protein
MMTNKGVRGKGANASSIQQAAPTENHFVTRAHLLQVLAIVFPTHRDSQVGKGAKMLKILSEGTKAAFGLIQSIPICKINKNSNAYYRMGTDDKLEAMTWRHTEDGPVYKGFTWRPLELSKPELALVRLQRFALLLLTDFLSVYLSMCQWVIKWNETAAAARGGCEIDYHTVEAALEQAANACPVCIKKDAWDKCEKAKAKNAIYRQEQKTAEEAKKAAKVQAEEEVKKKAEEAEGAKRAKMSTCDDAAMDTSAGDSAGGNSTDGNSTGDNSSGGNSTGTMIMPTPTLIVPPPARDSATPVAASAQGQVEYITWLCTTDAGIAERKTLEQWSTALKDDSQEKKDLDVFLNTCNYVLTHFGSRFQQQAQAQAQAAAVATAEVPSATEGQGSPHTP